MLLDEDTNNKDIVVMSNVYIYCTWPPILNPNSTGSVSAKAASERERVREKKRKGKGKDATASSSSSASSSGGGVSGRGCCLRFCRRRRRCSLPLRLPFLVRVPIQD